MSERSGTRVASTGLKLLHEGEYVVPAAGSEAVFASADDDGVHYHFPVEIDVRRSQTAAPSPTGGLSLDALAAHLGG